MMPPDYCQMWKDAEARATAAEQREAEKDKRIADMASQFEADANNAPDRSERLSLRFCAKNLRSLASPSTPSPAPKMVTRNGITEPEVRYGINPPSPAPSAEEPTP